MLCFRHINCTANLGCTLDLNKIVSQDKKAKYKKKKSAVIMYIDDPPTKAWIYNSGKMVCRTEADRWVTVAADDTLKLQTIKTGK